VDLLGQHGEAFNIEIRFRHKSGRLFDGLLSASVIDIDGEACMLSVTSDISERKRVELLVHQQNRMLHALGQAQADFITDADPDITFRQLLSHLLEITDSAYGFIGEVLRDEDGRPYLRTFAITDISWDEDSRALYARYQKSGFEFHNLGTLFGHVLTGEKPVLSNAPADDPRRGGLPHGHPPLQSFMGLPLHRGSHMVGMLGVANRPNGYDDALVRQLDPFANTCAVLIEAYRNSLRRRQAENLLRRLNEELEDRVDRRTADLQSSLNELEAFSYSVSHDLRSPLRGINGFSRLLLDDYGARLDGEGREHLQRICAATLRLSDLIDGMLDLAQITRAPMHPARVDLSVRAESVLRKLRLSQPVRQVEIVVQPGVSALGDERLLSVAMQNLLSNAWKFTSKQDAARIEFGSRTVAKETAYFVRDNGIGFDMQFADKLFRAFNRLHGMNEFAGTGIGLATVQRIVQRHRGRVWAEGEVGKGAVFYFTLPVVTEYQ
jgi:signal transduction histidine kinase